MILAEDGVVALIGNYILMADDMHILFTWVKKILQKRITKTSVIKCDFYVKNKLLGHDTSFCMSQGGIRWKVPLI